MTGHPAVDTVIYLSAALVALGTIWRYVLPALRVAWKAAKGTEEFFDSIRATGGFSGLLGLLNEVRVEVAEVKTLAQSSHRELHPNGGSSMRDTVNATAAGVHALGDKADRLEGYAAANREGIARLDTRVTDLDEKVDAQGTRITDHRRRNDETIAGLREFIEHEHREALLANEALRVSLAEALAVDRELQRDSRPDHEADLD